MVTCRTLLAVAGLPRRPGPPSRSHEHHAHRFRVAKAKIFGNKPVDNGDIGNNSRNLFKNEGFAPVDENAESPAVAVSFSSAYLGWVPESPVQMPDPAYLQGLNPPQREAVLTTEGPVLVLAGAGTGKTAALTARLAHLIAHPQGLAERDPRRHLHQQGGARDEGARVGASSASAIEGMPWLGTFHSIARQDAAPPRRAGRPAIATSPSSTPTTSCALHEAADPAPPNLDEKRWPARHARRADRPLEEPRLDPGPGRCRRGRGLCRTASGAELYAALPGRGCATLNACDFGDLLLHMLVIFRTHRDVLEAYQQRFRYILVDEYQDTNQGQYRWLRLLAEPRRNLCCVGDDDQSIYSLARRRGRQHPALREGLSRARRSSGSSRITARPRTSSPPPTG